MASNNPIKGEQIIEKGAFQPTINDVEELLKLSVKLEEQFKEILKVSKEQLKSSPYKNVDDIKRNAEAVDNLNTAKEGLKRTEKQRQELMKKIQLLTEQSKKSSEELELQLLKNKKALQELNKEQKKEGANLEEIAKKKAKLRAETTAITEVIRAEQKAIKDGLKVKGKELNLYQQQSKRLNEARNAYKNLFLSTKKNREGLKGLVFGFTKAGKGLRKLKKNVSTLDKELKDLDAQVGQNQRSVGNYEKATKKLSSAFKNLGRATGILLLLDSLKTAFSATSEGSAGLEKAMSRLTITAGVFIDRVLKVFSDESVTQWNFFKKLREGFKGFNDEVARSLELNDKAIDTEKELFAEIQKRKRINSALLVQQAELTIQADDNTKSIESQIRAANALGRVEMEILDNEIFIAEKQKEIAQSKADALTGDKSRQEALTDAILQLDALKAESAAKQLEIQKAIRERVRDSDELELDRLLDIADRRKTIAENIVADETKTFQERRDRLKEVNKDVEQSFIEQAKVISRTVKGGFDVNDLISETDTVEINKKIKALGEAGLDEKRQDRLREIIQERIQANRDLEESARDLNESERESNALKSDSELIEEALIELKKAGVDVDKELIELSDERAQTEIDNLRLELAELEDGSEKKVEIQQKLNEKLLDQQKAKIQKEKDAKDKAILDEEEADKERIERQKKVADALNEVTRTQFDKRNKAVEDSINNELDALNRREDALRDLASKGDADATKALVESEKRRAELARQKAKQAEREARQELILASFQAFTARLANGESGGEALSGTLTDITLLSSAISSLPLPAFKDGAERVGDHANPIRSGEDGVQAWIDVDERIMTADQNKQIGYSTSNSEVVASVELARRIKKGANVSRQDNSGLERRLDSIESAIINKRTYEGLDYNATEKSITQSYTEKGKIERLKMRKGAVLG